MTRDIVGGLKNLGEIVLKVIVGSIVLLAFAIGYLWVVLMRQVKRMARGWSRS